MLPDKLFYLQLCLTVEIFSTVSMWALKKTNKKTDRQTTPIYQENNKHLVIIKNDQQTFIHANSHILKIEFLRRQEVLQWKWPNMQHKTVYILLFHTHLCLILLNVTLQKLPAKIDFNHPLKGTPNHSPLLLENNNINNKILYAAYLQIHLTSYTDGIELY